MHGRRRHDCIDAQRPEEELVNAQRPEEEPADARPAQDGTHHAWSSASGNADNRGASHFTQPYSSGMTAKELADQATELASKLKPGTWDAVQALALASIAHSLAAMAQEESTT